MGVHSGLYVYDVVVKRLRSLSHLLMSSCVYNKAYYLNRLDSVKFGFQWINRRKQKSGGERSEIRKLHCYTTRRATF